MLAYLLLPPQPFAPITGIARSLSAVFQPGIGHFPFDRESITPAPPMRPVALAWCGLPTCRGCVNQASNLP